MAQFASAKTVDEIIEKYIKARGGKQKLSSLESICMEGIRETAGGQTKVKIMKEQAKLSRVEIETGDGTAIELVTDKQGWTYAPSRSPALGNIAGRELELLQHGMDIAGPLVDYIAKGHKAELLGKELTDGNTCYKIKLITREGTEIIFWIDTRTYLLHRSSVPGAGDGVAGGPTFTVYKNYKETDGTLFPFTCEKVTQGLNSYDIIEAVTFDKIILNPAIVQELFLAPGDVIR